MAPLLWINKVCKADLVEPVRFESHVARWRRMSTTCLAVGFLNTAKVSIKANGFVNGHLSGEIGPTEAHYKQCRNFWHLDSRRNLAEREYSWSRGTYPWLSVFLTDQMGRIRGRVTFFYREGLICTIHVGDDLNYGNESLSLQVNRLRCRPRIIGCVYRPPNQCMDELLGNMNYSLSQPMGRYTWDYHSAQISSSCLNLKYCLAPLPLLTSKIHRWYLRIHNFCVTASNYKLERETSTRSCPTFRLQVMFSFYIFIVTNLTVKWKLTISSQCLALITMFSA